jgi:hypothetical protein
MSDTPRYERRSLFAGYEVASLLLAVAGGLVGGTGERAVGTVAAWAVQCFAFRRLDTALSTGVDPRGPWLGGIAARASGLLIAGAAVRLGAASVDLPIAYGLTMVVLLFVEAGWLVHRGSVAGSGMSTAARDDHGIERTRPAG